MPKNVDDNGNDIPDQPIHPAEALILLLDKLRKRINKSGLERTIGLKDAMGENCTYYRKSLDIFMKMDGDELCGLIKECYNKILELKKIDA